MKMEQCSETSAYKIQTPGNYPKESIQHSEHGESLKSRIRPVCLSVRPSSWNNAAPTGRIFMKFNVRTFYENLSRKFRFH